MNSHHLALAKEYFKGIDGRDAATIAQIAALISIAEELAQLNKNLEYVTRENGGIVVDISN